jgi:hypothetical protein
VEVSPAAVVRLPNRFWNESTAMTTVRFPKTRPPVFLRNGCSGPTTTAMVLSLVRNWKRSSPRSKVAAVRDLVLKATALADEAHVTATETKPAREIAVLATQSLDAAARKDRDHAANVDRTARRSEAHGVLRRTDAPVLRKGVTPAHRIAVLRGTRVAAQVVAAGR